jgi:hypothetical protein
MATVSTVLPSYEIGSKGGKSQGIRQFVALELTAEGATAGDIPASLFGLKQITYVHCYGATISAADAAGLFFVGDIGNDGNYIYPVDLTQATDADRNDPADLTGTFYLMIDGIGAVA